MTALPADVTALLAAVVEALDVPLPGLTDADERAYARILTWRATDVRITLASILKFPDASITADAGKIRASTARTPLTYTPWQDPAPAAPDDDTPLVLPADPDAPVPYALPDTDSEAAR